MYSRYGDLATARTLFTEMKQNKVAPNVVTYTAFIKVSLVLALGVVSVQIPPSSGFFYGNNENMTHAIVTRAYPSGGACMRP